MNAVWDLVTTDAGPEIRYRNLFTGEDMLCGFANQMTIGEILDFMLREGCRGPEFVRWDGALLHLLPAPRSIC